MSAMVPGTHDGAPVGAGARAAGMRASATDPCAALPHPRARRTSGLQWDVISTGDSPARTIALQLPGNPLDAQWNASTLAPALEECTRVAHASGTAPFLIAWSGTFSDTLFGGDMRNWMRPGWDALQHRLDSWRGMLEAAGVRLALLPHATHLLSDVAGAMRLLVERAEQPFDVICAPAALLTPDMLGDGAREGTRGRIAEARDVREHLLRALSVIGPRTPLCILEDVRIAPGPETGSHHAREDEERGASLQMCAPGAGVLPWDTLSALALEHVPHHVPVLAK
jgi:hypothetical protein